MSSRLRHCVECPKCHTRYLLATDRYENGSYLIIYRDKASEEFTLYCSCGRPATTSRWTWSEVRRYKVSTEAYARGYGSAEEIALYKQSAAGSGRELEGHIDAIGKRYPHSKFRKEREI